MKTDSETHVLGVWMLFDPGVKDWFCQIAQHARFGPWTMEYRFRVYVDDKAHGSKDVKSAYHMQFKADTPKSVMVDAAQKMQKILKATGFGVEEWEMLIDSNNPDEFFRRLKECPHMHSVSVSTPEEAEAAGYPDLAAEIRAGKHAVPGEG